MPLVQLFLRHGTPVAYRKALSDGIHRAMTDVLGLPDDDFFHVIHETEPENLRQAPVFWGVARSDRSVLIQLMFNHRPPEQKQALFAAIVDNLVRDPGVRKEDIFMCIVETASENWWADARRVDSQTGLDARMSATAVHESIVDR